MNKYIIEYDIKDEYTFSFTSHTVVQSECIETIQLEFLDMLEKAYEKKHNDFEFLEITFFVKDYVYKGLFNTLTVMTVDDFLSDFKTI